MCIRDESVVVLSTLGPADPLDLGTLRPLDLCAFGPWKPWTLGQLDLGMAGSSSQPKKKKKKKVIYQAFVQSVVVLSTLGPADPLDLGTFRPWDLCAVGDWKR